ncbi:uncharacterized protein EDB91DRAFT_1274880 [Suillus paluster]|uniref:uncharacterized protein n=1 Tax=Suillus paluster TaxID=48578 RepID=UPI001B867907|nr:uncharacterized protein EDB91DRAFT_1274880 [Suillus paluster]KAG1721781.1 hypothetical protein EDB91DRAFT_1274880 [Suillus paluster]
MPSSSSVTPPVQDPATVSQLVPSPTLLVPLRASKMSKIDIPTFSGPLEPAAINAWLGCCEDSYLAWSALNAGQVMPPQLRIVLAGLKLDEPSTSLWWSENHDSILQLRVHTIPNLGYENLKVDALINVMATTWSSLVVEGLTKSLPTRPMSTAPSTSTMPRQKPAYPLPDLSYAEHEALHSAGDQRRGIPPRAPRQVTTVAAVTIPEGYKEVFLTHGNPSVTDFSDPNAGLVATLIPCDVVMPSCILEGDSNSDNSEEDDYGYVWEGTPLSLSLYLTIVIVVSQSRMWFCFVFSASYKGGQAKELCTTLDRLTGGSTIVLHHPGTTSPTLDISPENLKAEVYINPKVLLDHHELHSVIAQISQLFITDYAMPLARAFAKNWIQNNWNGSGSQMPLKGKTTSKGKGRANPTQIQHTREGISTSHLVRKEEPSWRTAVLAASVHQPMTLTVLNESSSSDQYERPHPPSNSDDRRYPPSNSNDRCYPPATPMKGKSVSSELSPPTPMLITARSTFELQHYNAPTLLPFGTEMEEVLEELGYPDHFHQVCISIGKDYLPKQWIMKLWELTEILEEHAEAIGNAMLTDSQPVTSFAVRITVMVLPVTACSHNPRWLVPQTRAPYIKVLKEATELASKFKQPRCRYLERLSLGSVIHRHKHNKTSAWHAYMHFKGIQNNTNKSFSEKSNIADVVKEKTEYHRLTAEEKEQLIIDFDKVKKSSQDCPPNITAKSRAAECSRSFQLVREELEALKECVGAEAFIVMVHGVSDFTIVPKAFFTSPAAEHFVHLYLCKDITQMATNFESTILANGPIMSKVMNNPSAVMEFSYNDLVQCYHVKLVGWNHPYWANPSDMKGGIKSLENVVLAIQANTCKFVTITPQEAKERMHCINDGEILTPDLKPSMPPDLLTPNSTHLANIHVALSEPYVHPSSFTDEMVDLDLHALDHATSENGPLMVQLPPTPPMPTPPLPMACEADVLVTATNHSKRTTDALPTGTSCLKHTRKLMEKGQSELESRNHAWCGPTKKGTQRSKKSNAHVESDHENT